MAKKVKPSSRNWTAYFALMLLRAAFEAVYGECPAYPVPNVKSVNPTALLRVIIFLTVLFFSSGRKALMVWITPITLTSYYECYQQRVGFAFNHRTPSAGNAFSTNLHGQCCRNVLMRLPMYSAEHSLGRQSIKAWFGFDGSSIVDQIIQSASCLDRNALSSRLHHILGNV